MQKQRLKNIITIKINGLNSNKNEHRITGSQARTDLRASSVDQSMLMV